MPEKGGYSRAHITRFIAQYRETGRIKERSYKRNRVARRYSMEDIRLLAETDELHSFPFRIAGFHADNGSELIDKKQA